jgi:hypothetical protein
LRRKVDGKAKQLREFTGRLFQKNKTYLNYIIETLKPNELPEK